MAYDVPLRETLEKAGYKVTWQGEGKPIKIEKGGQTYDILPNAYTVKNGKAYMDSSTLPSIMEKAGYQWVREAMPSGAGYSVNYNTKTGQVSVSHPLGGSYTFTNPVVVGGRAYVPSTEVQTATNAAGPAYKSALSQAQSDLAQYVAESKQRQDRYYALQDQMLKNYMNQVNNYISQYSDAALAMLNTYQQHYQQALQQLQKLMTPDTTVPETVKVALSILDKNLQESLNQLNEEMNRRGIYQSGLAAEMERKMREGALTEQEKIIAQWLDDVHQQAYDATLRYADYLTKYASGLSDLYGTAYLQPIQMAQQAASNAYSLASELAQSRYQEEQNLAKTAFDVANELRKLGMTYDTQAAQTLLQRQWELEDEQRKRQWELEDWEKEAQLQRELANIRAQQSSSSQSYIDPSFWALINALNQPQSNK